MTRRLALACTAAVGLLAAVLVAPTASAASAHAASKVQLCQGHRATIVGTQRDDVLVGTRGSDVIVGLGGNDRILGKGGRDWICGKDGYDRIFPGGGDDHIQGGHGGDTTHYSSGDDVINGGSSPSDVVDYGRAPSGVRVDVAQRIATFGAHEHDTFTGLEVYLLTRHADVFHAGGADTDVYSRRGDDVLAGGKGYNFFDAGPGDDRLNGGRGLDNLKGGTGFDHITDLQGRSFVWDGAPKHYDHGGVIRTGLFDDQFILYPGRLYDVDSGRGDDELTLRGKVAFSDVLTGDGDDSVIFRHPTVRGGVLALRMQDGDDSVWCPAVGCGANAAIHGGAGINSIELAAGAPAVTAVLGHVGSLIVHGPTDRTVFLEDIEEITTGGGNDDITGSDNAETFITGDGDDTVDALGGDDVVSAGDGNDTADGGDGNDQCYDVENPTSCETTG